MQPGNTKCKVVLFFLWTTVFALTAAAQLNSGRISGQVLNPQDHQVTTSGKGYPPQLSGTVVDASGAVIAAATVQVLSANGAAERSLQSDSSGSFSISGLSAGNYQLIVSSPGFETKEIPVTMGTTGQGIPLRISLAVSAVSTNVEVQGRADDLVGIADSAGQITVGAEELEDRPILRSGEILETLPGLIIAQHAGGGKANQYFLRGFNLDHGTDIAIFLDGMPLNLPSQAHGEGYADMNTVTPEFVERVDAEKGPYYPDVGDYGSAGNATVVFYKTLPQNFVEVQGGQYGFGRFVFGVSQKVGSGTLTYGGEAYHDNGPWKYPDNYYKFNGLLTYSQGDAADGFSITVHAYDGARWNSSDQLPYTAIPVAAFFGALNPTDGGRSQRYSLQGEWHHRGENSETQIMVYGFYYDLNLFSDFTYYLYNPYMGDQFEQQDRRWVAGFDARQTIFNRLFGRNAEITFGLQFRNDWIHNGLFRTLDRMRTYKIDYISNYSTVDPAFNQFAVFPAATDINEFKETIISPWVQTTIHWGERFRSVVGLRGDFGIGGPVTSFTNPTSPNYPNYPSNLTYPEDPNSDRLVNKFLPSPKASLILGPWANTEVYLQGGFSYHTNDVRGSTQLYEPVSPDYPFYNTPNPIKIPFLVQTKGTEIGVRTVAVPHLQSTVEVWGLHSNSELLQDGDTGGTSPSYQSSNRWGVEVGNYYTPLQHLILDADFADSRARFTANDPRDSAFYYYNQTTGTYQLCPANSNCYGVGLGPTPYLQNPYGKYVPEAVRVVVSAGATLHDYKSFSASLRLRYFGPRPLTSDGLYTSPSTALVNLLANYRFSKNWSITGEILNLLNRQDHDIDYAYVSQIKTAAQLGLPATPPTTLAGQEAVEAAINANAAFTRVLHPVEPIQARFGLRYSFGR